MSVIEKLKAGSRHIKTIKYPGTEKDIALKALSNAELQEAVFAAERHFQKENISTAGSSQDAYADERTTQILFRALRDPEDTKKPVASSADELRKALKPAEKDWLVAEYNAFQEECAPQLKEMTDEQFEEIWASLKKSPETVSSCLSSGALKRLLLYLASRPESSPTDNGSGS